nr:MAG TPA: hypothetical protein [Caudoviricetes sp.]
MHISILDADHPISNDFTIRKALSLLLHGLSPAAAVI